MKLVIASGAPAEDIFARLDDTRFNLVIIGQQVPELPTAWPIAVHEILDAGTNIATLARANICVPCYFLLRPDGYIGLTGKRLRTSDVQQYIAERLHGEASETRPAHAV
jgi:hypothetical protein